MCMYELMYRDVCVYAVSNVLMYDLKMLVGNPEGKRLLGRPGHRWA
jgi:hypothetical protein